MNVVGKKKGKEDEISDYVCGLNDMGATWETGESQDLSKI